jgi:LEA14-like dessication related protein
VLTNATAFRPILLVLALLLFGVQSGCGLIFSSPEVVVKDVTIVGLDPTGLDLELYISVVNPNTFPIILTGYNYDLHVSALPLAKGGARQSLEFKANATTAVRLPVRLAMGSVVELLKRRPDPERIPYRLLAGLQIDTPLGERVVAIDKDGSFTIPPRYRPSQWLKSFQGAVDELLFAR